MSEQINNEIEPQQTETNVQLTNTQPGEDNTFNNDDTSVAKNTGQEDTNILDNEAKTNTTNTVSIDGNTKSQNITHHDGVNYVSEFNGEFDPNILDKLDDDIQLKMQNKIKSHLIYSALFWIRILILLLSIALIMLALSYTFGAISDTQMILVSQCAGYDIEEIWQHSKEVGKPQGVLDSCWTTSTLRINEDEAYAHNTYAYKTQYNGFAIFQCVIFSLFTIYAIIVFIYGIYSILVDFIAIRNHKLYESAPKYKIYLKTLNNNYTVKKTPNVFIAFIMKLKFQYELYFGIDTYYSVARMIIMEMYEIMLQTFALLLYNGYNIWNPENVHLAYRPVFIYLFVSMLSFNCIVVGILWLLYVIKPNKCSGLLFKLFEFCIDQICDLFYVLFPFIVVFKDPSNKLQGDGKTD
eukprot:46499_1